MKSFQERALKQVKNPEFIKFYTKYSILSSDINIILLNNVYFTIKDDNNASIWKIYCTERFDIQNPVTKFKLHTSLHNNINTAEGLRKVLHNVKIYQRFMIVQIWDPVIEFGPIGIFENGELKCSLPCNSTKHQSSILSIEPLESEQYLIFNAVKIGHTMTKQGYLLLYDKRDNEVITFDCRDNLKLTSYYNNTFRFLLQGQPEYTIENVNKMRLM